MTPRITLIGMGDDGLSGLSTKARQRLARGHVVYASARLLRHIADDPELAHLEQHAWPSPFDVAFSQFSEHSARRIIILASGDPTWHGIGKLLYDNPGPARIETLPAPSAFSLVAARMGWALQDVKKISLHGKSHPVSLLVPHLHPGNRIIALTSDAQTVPAVLQVLARSGYGPSTVTVFEHLAGKDERSYTVSPQATPDIQTASLNTLAITCRKAPETPLQGVAPGLIDSAFVNDGQLTKSEVRAITIAALRPYPGALLWDAGAGCGSVAIEWMRCHPCARAIAFEQNAKRSSYIAENAQNLGTPGLKVITGTMPGCLAGQPTPDAVFLGGGVAGEAIFDALWQALKPGGILVANAVTIKAQRHLTRLNECHNGELVSIAIARAENLGASQTLRPALPVLQLRLIKP